MKVLLFLKDKPALTGWKEYLWRIGLATLAYFGTVRLGLLFVIQPEGIAGFWPASGVGLALLLLARDRREKSIVALIIFGVNFFLDLAVGYSLLSSAGFSLANTLEPVVGMWGLQRLAGRRVTFKRLADVLSLTVVAGLSSMAAALVGAAAAWSGFGAPYWMTWRNWWIEDALGILVITPLILTWQTGAGQAVKMSLRRQVEALLLLAAAIFQVGTMFGLPETPIPFELRPYFLFPILAWAALRYRPDGMIALLAVISMVMFALTAAGAGNFPLGEAHSTEQLIRVQIFLGIAAITGLILAAVFAERRQTEERLLWNAHVNAALTALYDPLTTPGVTIQEITRDVLAQARELTHSQHGYVSEIDPFTGNNIGHTLTEMLQGYCQVEGEKKSIVFAREASGQYSGLWGHALNTRQAFYTNTPGDHPAARGIPNGHIPLSGFLTVPVMLSGQMVGQIALANPDRPYEERDLQAIQRLAEFYALAIQRMRAEDELRRNEKRFRAMVEHGADAFGLVSTDGSILYEDPSAARLSGYTTEERAGRSAMELVYPEDLPVVQAAFTSLMAQPGKTVHIVFRSTRKDGSIWWTETTASNLTEEPDIQAIVINYRDITTRKLAEEARQQAEEQIRKALAEKEALLRELYHRTKNNMSVIIALLDFQGAEFNDQRLKGAFEDTKSRILAMSLVHQKLYEAQDLSHLNLKDYIRDLVDLLMGGYPMEPASIKVAYEMVDVYVLIDIAIPCGMVINELVTNALKYAFPNDYEGALHIQLERKEDGLVCFRVADNGVGPPAGFNFRRDGRLGLQNVFTLIEKQLKGKITFEVNDGVSCAAQFYDNLYHRRV